MCQYVKIQLTTFLIYCCSVVFLFSVFGGRSMLYLAENTYKRLRTVESRLLGYQHNALIRTVEQLAGILNAQFVYIVVEGAVCFTIEESTDVCTVGANSRSNVRHLKIWVEEYLPQFGKRIRDASIYTSKKYRSSFYS